MNFSVKDQKFNYQPDRVVGKSKAIFILWLLMIIVTSCSKKVTFTSEHIAQTSGRYLLNQDEVLDVYYEQNNLFLKWRGAERMEPVVLDDNTFFVVDMYKKLRFVQDKATKQRYLGIVSETDDTIVTYDYIKVADSFKTPSMYLKSKDYDKALVGYLKIKEHDSTSILIEEREFNSLGYELVRKREFDNAIAVFKMNAALYPDSDNVYDSLADAYLRSGDSLQAFTNYNKALELNSGNKRAKRFVDMYDKK
jgi:tetratricopeptide (TPR) repeat protein